MQRKLVSRGEFAERLGVTANTVRDRFKEHETRDERGRIAYPAEIVETALQLDAEVAQYDADCTVTPQSFAEQLGWHPKSVINKFREHARIVDKKLMFPAAFVAKVVAEQGFDASAYTVSVADAAKALHCSQQSVKALLRRRGKLRGKKLFYNPVDVVELVVKRDDVRWVPQMEVVELLQCNWVQLWFLYMGRKWSSQAGFAKWRLDLPEEDFFPDYGRVRDAYYWRAIHIIPWCEAFVQEPHLFLTKESLEEYRRIADIEQAHNNLRSFAARRSLYLMEKSEEKRFREGRGRDPSIDVAIERRAERLSKLPKAYKWPTG